MKLFLPDVIMGVILTLMLFSILAGLFVYRNRRETGPLILLLSGIAGIAGPILHLLVQTDVIEIDSIFSLIPVAVWILGVLIAVLAWRKKG